MNDINDLLGIMEQLRDPENGCPWDRKQTFATIASYTLQEVYEVIDAIERKHFSDLQDELGDLLFQVVYHCQMAKEAKQFCFADIVDSVSNKMLRRHPHVFGNEDMPTIEEQTLAWEKIKVEEHKQKGNTAESLLDTILLAQPALMRAHQIQNKAAQFGFDWSELEPVFSKIDEEITEIREAIQQKYPRDVIAQEVGDLFFACVNLARKLNVDPELATQKTNNKFCIRFRYIEQELMKQGKTVDEVSLATLDLLWEQAKTQE